MEISFNNWPVLDFDPGTLPEEYKDHRVDKSWFRENYPDIYQEYFPERTTAVNSNSLVTAQSLFGSIDIHCYILHQATKAIKEVVLLGLPHMLINHIKRI